MSKIIRTMFGPRESDWVCCLYIEEEGAYEAGEIGPPDVMISAANGDEAAAVDIALYEGARIMRLHPEERT